MSNKLSYEIPSKQKTKQYIEQNNILFLDVYIVHSHNAGLYIYKQTIAT